MMSTFMLFILIIFLTVILLILGVFVHAGYFSDVRIRTSFPASIPRRFAYTVHRGPYRNVHVPLGEIATFAPKLRKFCVFYDDPKKVPENELRWIVGCELMESSKLEVSLKEKGHSVFTFPECTRAVITEFPDRNLLSCMIAPRIVYPALSRYFEEFDIKEVGPILEVYRDGYTQYIAPLENTDRFFVPEITLSGESKKSQ